MDSGHAEGAFGKKDTAKDALSESFFELGTGVAGSFVQKWVTYRVKTAAVFT